jgi:hypothetical protein
MNLLVRQSTAKLLTEATAEDEDEGQGRKEETTTTTHDLTAEFARVHKPHKPSANVTSTKGRQYTVSVALPGSIVNNAQTWELKTALVGQVRAILTQYTSLDKYRDFLFQLTHPVAWVRTDRTGLCHFQRERDHHFRRIAP